MVITLQRRAIPSREDRELREITRYRQSLIEERSQELNRIQATLEGANIKLGSAVTDISGKTSMEILSAIADGNTNPESLSQPRNTLPYNDQSASGTYKIIEYDNLSAR